MKNTDHTYTKVDSKTVLWPELLLISVRERILSHGRIRSQQTWWKTKSFKTFKSSCLGKRYQILLVIWSMQGFFFWPFKLPLIKIIPHNTCPWVLLLDLSISGACLHYSSTLKRTARGILKNLIVRLKKDGKALREVSALLEISRNICSRNQELQNEPQHH